MSLADPRKRKVDWSDIVECYKSGKSSREVGKLFGITPSYVAHIVRKEEERLGIKLTRNKSEANLDKTRLHSIDQSFFEVIDTEEKAYIVGWIMSDGYNNVSRGRLEINIVHTDRLILEKMNLAMKNTLPIIDLNPSKKPSKFNLALKSRLSFQCRKMSDDLVKLGITKGKTQNLKFPTYIPSHLMNHFIRGYFDGDGCITYNKSRNDLVVDFASSRDFNESLVEFFKNNEPFVNFHVCQRKGCTSAISSGNFQVVRFMEWLYKDATIWLDRKKDRYEELKILISANKNPQGRKVVIRIDPTTLEETEYESLTVAGEKNIVHNATICRAIQSGNKSGGYYWKYHGKVVKTHTKNKVEEQI